MYKPKLTEFLLQAGTLSLCTLFGSFCSFTLSRHVNLYRSLQLPIIVFLIFLLLLIHTFLGALHFKFSDAATADAAIRLSQW